MPDRLTLARVGLAYLENAVLETLGALRYARPADIALRLGLYPDARFYDRPAGSWIVQGILEACERDGRVRRANLQSPFGAWQLTERERSRRGL